MADLPIRMCEFSDPKYVTAHVLRPGTGQLPHGRSYAAYNEHGIHGMDDCRLTRDRSVDASCTAAPLHCCNARSERPQRHLAGIRASGDVVALPIEIER